MIKEALIVLGYKTHEAAIVEYLNTVESSFSHDIERACNIRQPEVSLALSNLKARGAVTFDLEYSENKKGAPRKRYRLLKGMIKHGLKEFVKNEYNEKMKAINVIELRLK